MPDEQKEVTIESLQAELAEKNAELLEAYETIEAQAETISTLEAKIVAQNLNPSAFPIIEVEGKKYEVQIKSFQLGKEVITVEKLLADSDLQAKAVAKGFGFLVEIAE